MEGPTVLLAVVDSRIEAELLVGLLISHGLTASYQADDVGGQEPQLQRQGVRIMVAPSDEAAAIELLASPSAD